MAIDLDTLPRIRLQDNVAELAQQCGFEAIAYQGPHGTIIRLYNHLGGGIVLGRTFSAHAIAFMQGVLWARNS